MEKMPTNPYAASRYLRPIEGTIRVRIFDYIDGFEYWKNSEGEVVARSELGGPGSTPVRLRKQDLDQQPIEVKNAVTAFRAYRVYNVDSERSEILTLKQATINESLIDLYYDEDWGEGKGLDTFDITITGTGKGRDRRYSVVPKPPKSDFNKDMEPINLEALYENGDPFESSENIDLDEVEKSLDEVTDDLGPSFA